MADTKISALTASTTPLAGTEVLPIVQSGITKQVSVANLTAGRAISATQLTLTTGNLIVANGQGIDFSATPGTGTSELLADYEEGTWTPALTFDNAQVGSFTYGTQVGTYTKVGRIVMASFNLAWSARPSAGQVLVLNLPFTAVNAANVRGFISDQGGITNIGTYAILAGDGLVISSYVSTQCSIATVQSGAGFADPLQQTALTSASGQLRGEIIFEVS